MMLDLVRCSSSDLPSLDLPYLLDLLVLDWYLQLDLGLALEELRLVGPRLVLLLVVDLEVVRLEEALQLQRQDSYLHRNLQHRSQHYCDH